MNRGLGEHFLDQLPGISVGAVGVGAAVFTPGFVEHMTGPLTEDTPAWATAAEIIGIGGGGVGILGGMACAAVYGYNALKTAWEDASLPGRLASRPPKDETGNRQ